MNTIELFTLITPIAGLAAGTVTAAGAGPAAMVAGAVGGLAMGVAVHPGPLFAVSKIPNLAADRFDRWIKASSTRAWLMAMVFLLYVVASPAIAWRLSCFAVSFVISSIQGSGGG